MAPVIAKYQYICTIGVSEIGAVARIEETFLDPRVVTKFLNNHEATKNFLTHGANPHYRCISTVPLSSNFPDQSATTEHEK